VINVTSKSKIVNGVMHKQCSRCKRFKPLDEFYKFERGAFSVMSICRECIKQYERGRRAIRQKRCNDRYKNDSEYREQKNKRAKNGTKQLKFRYKDIFYGLIVTSNTLVSGTDADGFLGI